MGRPGDGGARRWHWSSEERREVGELGKTRWLVGLERKIGEESGLRENRVFFFFSKFSLD